MGEMLIICLLVLSWKGKEKCNSLYQKYIIHCLNILLTYYYLCHVISWPCLHQWLETRPSRQVCPVCKAAISRDKVIPLYGRGNTKQEDPRNKVCFRLLARPNKRKQNSIGVQTGPAFFLSLKRNNYCFPKRLHRNPPYCHIFSGATCWECNRVNTLCARYSRDPPSGGVRRRSCPIWSTRFEENFC